MKPRLTFVPVLVAIVAGSLLAGPLSPGSAREPNPAAASRAGSFFTIYASCGDSKPFKPAKSCRYDSSTKFRGTFVLRSKVGPVKVKACFRIKGRAPLGGGHACGKAGPLTVKNYPFKITGVRQSFRVKVTWFVKKPGAGTPFAKAGSSTLKVSP